MPANTCDMTADMTVPSNQVTNREKPLNLIEVWNFQTCASIKKSQAEDMSSESWDCQVRSDKVGCEDCGTSKVRNKLTKKAPQTLVREINFSSKLVKVTKDDMREKPKRTRNWKGRRAAERNKLNRMRELQSVSEPLATPPCHPKPLSPSQGLPGAHDGKSPLTQDTNAEENFSDFLTSLGGVPDIEEYFRWALPHSPRTPLDAAIAGHSQRSFGCAAQGMKKPSGAGSPPRDGAHCWSVGEDQVAGSVYCGSCWRLYFGMLIEKVVESERLKRQEDEVLRKIERFLRRNVQVKDERMKKMASKCCESEGNERKNRKKKEI